MSPLAVLRLALAVAFLVAVPGFLLVRALFPRAGLTRIERGYLAVASGILLLMLVGVTLGSVPGWPLFAPVPVAAALAAVSLGLFGIGLQRGAYPRLRRAVRTAGSASPGTSQGPALRRP